MICAFHAVRPFRVRDFGGAPRPLPRNSVREKARKITFPFIPMTTKAPSDSPRLLIVGCGGIGGVLGASLHSAGQEIHIATPNEAVRARWAKTGPYLGSKLVRPCLPLRQIFCSASEATGTFDLVFVAVQPPQIEAVAQELEGKLSQEGRVVCLSNGLCEPRLGRYLGDERVLGAVVSWGARMPQPGFYQRTSRGRFLLGSLVDQPPAVCETTMSVLSLMAPVTFTRNLRGARYSKLAMNCAVSALGTIGGDTLGALLVQREARELALRIIHEALLVAAAEGVVLEKVANVDLQKLIGGDLWADQAARHALLLAIGAKYRKLRSSMLASMERGRPPAVDFLNGEIVLRGAACGVKTPYNTAAGSVIWSIHRGELYPGASALSEVTRRAQG